MLLPQRQQRADDRLPDSPCQPSLRSISPQMDRKPVMTDHERPEATKAIQAAHARMGRSDQGYGEIF
jgi:hypothetical protein